MYGFLVWSSVHAASWNRGTMDCRVMDLSDAELPKVALALCLANESVTKNKHTKTVVLSETPGLRTELNIAPKRASQMGWLLRPSWKLICFVLRLIPETLDELNRTFLGNQLGTLE